jgi:hypothetical protein
MDNYTLVTEFGKQYAKDQAQAFHSDDWDERASIHKEAEWVISEMRKIVAAVNTLNRYDIKVG